MSATSSPSGDQPPHPHVLSTLMTRLPTALAALAILLTVAIGLAVSQWGFESGLRGGTILGTAVWAALLLHYDQPVRKPQGK